MHLVMQAEVDLSEIRDNLGALSREERVDLIRAHGDPAISTAVIIKDAEVRGAPEGRALADCREHPQGEPFTFRISGVVGKG